MDDTSGTVMVAESSVEKDAALPLDATESSTEPGSRRSSATLEPPADAEAEVPADAVEEAPAAPSPEPSASRGAHQERQDDTSAATQANAPLADEAAQADAKASQAEASCSSEKAKESFGVYREAIEQMNQQLGEIDFINVVYKRTRIPPLMIVAATVCSIASFCLFGFGSEIIITFLGIMYPAFESFKCVEAFSDVEDPSKVYSSAATMQFWLIYWVVVAAFSTVEYAFYYVLIWVPFYYPLKLILLLWLYLPQTRGANHLYHWLVAPILRKNRHKIDNVVDKSTAELRRRTSSAVAAAAQASVKGGAGGIVSAARLVRSASTDLGGAAIRKLSTLSAAPTADDKDVAEKKHT